MLEPLLAQAWGECYWYSGPPGAWAGDWRALLAEVSGETVGAVAFRAGERRVELGPWGPAVLPAWRGRGVGRALVEAAAAGRPLRYVMRFVAARQGAIAARPFLRAYVRWGFRRDLRLAMLARLEPGSAAEPMVPGLSFHAEADLKVIFPLYDEIFRTSHDPEAAALTPAERRQWLEQTRQGARGHSPPDMWQVAMLGGSPAGLLIMTRQTPGRCFVADLGVLPALRGRGLGAALCARAARLARAAGASELALMVSGANRPAIRLYRRFGYRTAAVLAVAERD